MRKALRSAVLAAGLLAATIGQAQMPPGALHIQRNDAPSQDGAIDLYREGSLPASNVIERWGRVVGDIGPIHIDQPFVRNVTRPTITPVLPDPAHATGAAVIVAPGGAFLSLSMESEGFAVARWLAGHGIAAFVLKYRLNETPEDDGQYMARVAAVFATAGRGDVRPAVSEPRATADAIQALRMVRERAARWGVDPSRVGMIGFSAGAMTALQAALAPAPADRPAFFGYIYGPMGAVQVPAEAPPMFAALALDDGLFGRQGFGIVESWHAANRPVELHAYEAGDHGFGMGRRGTTSTLVMEEFHLWLAARGLLAAPAATGSH